MQQAFLKVNSIFKSFGHIEALRGVSLEAYFGEVLAIVGDNGAGKSTLIKVLSGAVNPDKGDIIISGKGYHKLKPKQAMELGISTVYQDLALADTRDVVSNVFLGRELRKGIILNKKAMLKETEALIKDLKIKIDGLTLPVANLSGGQRQGVAVARAINQGGRLFIFDEPTAAMGLIESSMVLQLIRDLAGKGYGVIVISHNLQQVFEIADRVCIMRQGMVASIVKTSEVKAEDVVGLITGACSVA